MKNKEQGLSIERTLNLMRTLLKGCRAQNSDSTLPRVIRIQNSGGQGNPGEPYQEEPGYSWNQGPRALSERYIRAY